MAMALASPLAAMRAPTALRARASAFVSAPSPRLARRNAPTRRARLAGAVAYTEWVLDAPGCMPFREVEEVAESPGGGSRTDRHVTRRVLKVPSATENEGVVLDRHHFDKQRMETTTPLDLSALMGKDASHRSAIVGDATSFAAAFQTAEGDPSEAEAARAEGEAPPALACDVASFADGEHALAQFSTDGLGNLYVMDLPGEHELKVDGTAVGKEHKVRLWPGWQVDLSGKGGKLLYQVYRDEHAHA